MFYKTGIIETQHVCVATYDFFGFSPKQPRTTQKVNSVAYSDLSLNIHSIFMRRENAY
jgi:hypothetical protein